jgi:amidase
MTAPPFDVVEASIADLRSALDEGQVTSVELVVEYLRRIGAYDRSGITLNAVPVLDPLVFQAARASDERRSQGVVLSRLDGIPYTVKDSYKVRGLRVAAGSPAFADLVANDDAFAIEGLREAGAVLIGLTNMPPMANGGMQRGVYGRAESPYNEAFLTSAYASGSSNGSGTATAASFGAFGLGEETWSSGRAPASSNGLVAYTPSRGVISVRGNWPLVPTMDVVVPHTRNVSDLLEVLDVLVADDPRTDGDLWRSQEWVPLPASSSVRPQSYPALTPLPLAGLRLGVPRMYVNGALDNANPITTRASVIRLFDALRADLEAQGASVIDVAFPVVERYEKLTPGTEDMVDRGLVPKEFAEREIWDLSMAALDGFLRANGQAGVSRLADVDPALLSPLAPGTLPDRFGEYDFDIGDYVERARRFGVATWNEIPTIAEGLIGLEETRRVDYEEWLDEEGLDGVVFPALADVAPADADVNEASFEIAWRNGVWVANGNLVPRHLGIPTVTVPMGLLDDIGMPVGATIAGRAYDDTRLLQLALAVESTRNRRVTPARTPVLGSSVLQGLLDSPGARRPTVRLDTVAVEGSVVRFAGHVEDATAVGVSAWVDGVPVAVTLSGNLFHGESSAEGKRPEHSPWRPPYQPLVVAIAADGAGAASGDLRTVDGAPL